jgi:hypothetical protein
MMRVALGKAKDIYIEDLSFELGAGLDHGHQIRMRFVNQIARDFNKLPLLFFAEVEILPRLKQIGALTCLPLKPFMMIAPEIHKSRYLPWRQDAFKDRPYVLLETIEMPAIGGINRHAYHNNRRYYSQSDLLHHFSAPSCFSLFLSWGSILHFLPN